MSNWLPSHYDDFEDNGGQASMTNQLNEHEQMHFDDAQSPHNWDMHSDYCVWSHPKSNQSSDDSDSWKQFNEDFNISTSLKPNIWSNSSQNIPTNQQSIFSPNTQRLNIARASLSEPVISTSKQTINKLDNQWDSINSTANNVIAFGRRPITSGNGTSYTIQPAACGIENKLRGVSTLLLPLPNGANPIEMTYLAEESPEKFMLKLQTIVKNGFLSPNILTEPISPDTYDWINMLVYHVIEYNKIRRYALPDVVNAALEAAIRDIFRKIGLVRSQIEICQLKFIESKRIEQETLQSFAQRPNVATRPQTFNYQRNFRHGEQPMIRDSNYTNDAKSIHPNQSSNLTLSNEAQYHRRLIQSTNQCQVNQAQQQNAVQRSAPKDFQFLPKAKNCKNLFNLNIQTNNNDASQRSDDQRSLRKEWPI